MLHIILSLLILINFSSGENCDKFGVVFYEDIGCTPVTKGSDCPTNFECKELKKDDNKCLFRGRAYNPSEQLDSDLSYQNCHIGCRCTPEQEFTCAILDCPEWLGVPLTPGCYRNYTAGKCCATGEICPPFDESIKCEVDGEVYKEGERFSPKDSCYTCVCSKGFNGKYEEPYCKRKTCALQINRVKDIYDHCAPLYLSSEESRCCPSDLICPNEDVTIKGEAKGELECQFGKHVLKLGQYVEVKRENVEKLVKCECALPPFATCIAEV